jgi:Ca2+-binding EF-hand superfamily protein
MFEAGLEKQSRLFDRDLGKLELTASELKDIYRAFAQIDSNGDGLLSETKWSNFLLRNVRKDKAESIRQASEAKRQAEAKKEMEAKASKGTALDRARLAAELNKNKDEQKKAEKAAAEAAAKAAAEEAASSTTPRRKYARRLFHVFSRAGRGECDFGEFACSVLEFLAPLPWPLIHFAFMVYDTDGSGTLQIKPGTTGLPPVVQKGALARRAAELAGAEGAEAAAAAAKAAASSAAGASTEVNALEILALAKEIANAMPTRAGGAFAAEVTRDIMLLQSSEFEVETGPDGALRGAELRHITEEEFAAVALRYPAVLYPALRLQESLRLRMGGTKLWERITARKLAATGGKRAVLTAGQAWIASIARDVQVAKRRGEDLVPMAVVKLSEDVRRAEDLAPAQDVAFLKLQYVDAFGRVMEFRRGKQLKAAGGGADPRDTLRKSDSKSSRSLKREGGGKSTRSLGGVSSSDPVATPGGGGGSGNASPMHTGSGTPPISRNNSSRKDISSSSSAKVAPAPGIGASRRSSTEARPNKK